LEELAAPVFERNVRRYDEEIGGDSSEEAENEKVPPSTDGSPQHARQVVPAIQVLEKHTFFSLNIIRVLIARGSIAISNVKSGRTSIVFTAYPVCDPEFTLI